MSDAGQPVVPQLPTAPGQVNIQDFISQILAQYPLAKSVPDSAATLSADAEKKAVANAGAAGGETAKSTSSKSSPASQGSPQTLTDGILNMNQIMPVVHAMMMTGDHQGLGDLLTGKSKFADTGLGKAAAAIEKFGPILAGL